MTRRPRSTLGGHARRRRRNSTPSGRHCGHRCPASSVAFLRAPYEAVHAAGIGSHHRTIITITTIQGSRLLQHRLGQRRGRAETYYFFSTVVLPALPARGLSKLGEGGGPEPTGREHVYQTRAHLCASVGGDGPRAALFNWRPKACGSDRHAAALINSNSLMASSSTSAAGP